MHLSRLSSAATVSLFLRLNFQEKRRINTDPNCRFSPPFHSPPSSKWCKMSTRRDTLESVNLYSWTYLFPHHLHRRNMLLSNVLVCSPEIASEKFCTPSQKSWNEIMTFQIFNLQLSLRSMRPFSNVGWVLLRQTKHFVCYLLTLDRICGSKRNGISGHDSAEAAAQSEDTI